MVTLRRIFLVRKTQHWRKLSKPLKTKKVESQPKRQSKLLGRFPRSMLKKLEEEDRAAGNLAPTVGGGHMDPARQRGRKIAQLILEPESNKTNSPERKRTPSTQEICAETDAETQQISLGAVDDLVLTMAMVFFPAGRWVIPAGNLKKATGNIG